MTAPSFSPVPLEAYGDLRLTLDAAGLPSTDVAEPGRLFFCLSDAASVLGFIGLEGDGPDRLVRSLVVRSPSRRQRDGTLLLTKLEAHAARVGVRRLHLLTATAAPFFKARGYEEADRSAAPEAIKATAQFSSLCPGSAAYLVKDIA